MKGRLSASSCQRSSLGFLLLFFIGFLQAQDTYQVTVVDENNTPLIGVEAFTADYKYGEVTDVNGVLLIPEKYIDQEIIFNYLGYEELSVMGRLIVNKGGMVSLAPTDQLIEEIILIGRNELDPDALPYNVQSIGAIELAATNPQTAADALAHHANVYVQKSQMGGGSPVLRGFEANKVLLVVDGVRMNNAIYRSGHLQNAITVDQAMLDQMEVIFGPNALIYGSDALGGVIHFKSRLPKLNYDKTRSIATETNYYVRHSTANNERTGHVDFNLGGEKFASLTSISFSDFGNLRTGANRTSKYPDFGLRPKFVETIDNEDIEVVNDDPNVQVGTSYSQIDVLQKLLYQANDELQFVYNLQYSNSTNVPRYDRLTELDNGELTFAEWYYGPQQRFFSSMTMKHVSKTKLYDKAIVIAAYQKIDEDRIDRRFGRTARATGEEDVNVWNFTLDFHKGKPEDKLKLYYGVDYNYNKVNSVAFEEDIVTGVIDTDVLTRYPSEASSMSTVGAYLQLHLSDEKQLRHLNLGVRYTANFLAFRYDINDPIDWPQDLTDGISSQNDALIGSIGYVHNTPTGWQLSSLLSTAYRTPNIDDMAKIRVKGDEVSFPNVSLTPENSVNGEITIAKSILDQTGNQKLKVSLTGFATRLNNAIIREPFAQANGASILISGIDTFNIFANVNAARADVYGVSANLNYTLSQNLELNSSFNWTKGKVLEPQRRPLSHIPPIYGKVSIQYKAERWNLQYVSRYNAKKPIEDYGDSSDNPEYATPEGALAWHTMNLYTHYDITDKIQLSVGLENILDTHYRQFASGVSAPGRNAIITLRGKF